MENEWNRCWGYTSQMTGNMISLSAAGPAVLPLAGQTEVVGALSADVVITKMVVQILWNGKGLGAVAPEALMSWGRLELSLLRSFVIARVPLVVVCVGDGRQSGGG